MKDKVVRIMKENGFLVFLFICVCIVAIGTISIVTKEVDKDRSDNDLIILDHPVDIEETGRIESDINNTLDLEREEIILDEDYKIPEKIDEESGEIVDESDYIEEVFLEEDQVYHEEIEFIDSYIEEEAKVNTKAISPVQGEVITEFAKDKLIYSETLDEWRGHSGIDIKADLGTKVIAALDGTVKEVYEDILWGKIIVIDHGDDLLSKYCNLGTLEMVKEGLQVKQGDNIATVGKSAQIELEMDPHLHFELISKKKSVDPRSIIP